MGTLEFDTLDRFFEFLLRGVGQRPKNHDFRCLWSYVQEAAALHASSVFIQLGARRLRSREICRVVFVAVIRNGVPPIALAYSPSAHGCHSSRACYRHRPGRGR